MSGEEHTSAALLDPTPLSGRQYELSFGEYEATVASVGASLRRLTYGGRHLVVPFDASQVRPAYRGATLAPWPNRVVDGRYRFAGEEHQLALSEPERGHALHGLVAWQDFELGRRQEHSVELVGRIPAQQGYPHQILVRVRFTLDAAGLLTEVTGTNLAHSAAPWGTGPHPYLVAGPAPVDGWTLQIPADRVLTVTADRLIPVGLIEVETEQGGAFDFRTARPIGDTRIDHAFTGLRRDHHGMATVEVRSPAGEGVSIRCDSSCEWVQVHTADRPDPAENRIGLAVEPMTCAPDAFNSGLGLVELQPGADRRASWRITAVEPSPG